ncbi:MAG: GlsB/YeaQ/YmgE family stress response membrane protein [Rhodobacteraceae bacterium]|nr:GlsB/YeaQ/YmgE family stress response membrane protein [Paracoccaceae bacterium]
MLFGLMVAVIIGGIVGWLAGIVVKGGGMGLVGNVIVGILGGVLAGWLLPRVGIPMGDGWAATIGFPLVGAIIILLVLRLIRR